MGIMQKQFADLITFTRASAGGYRNWQGAYTMAAANEPRIDHDPASVSLSTATVTLGAGQHTFTTTHAYPIGKWLRASADANNWMVGRVVAAGEGSVTIEVTAARRGSGTYSSWTLIRPLGLLIEEQRTNLLTHSSDFANAVWVKDASGAASPPTVTADPGLAASRVVFSLNGATDTSFSRLVQNVSGLSNPHSVSRSAWVKSATGATYTMAMPNEGGIRLVTIGPEWTRLEQTNINVSASTSYCQLRLRASEGTSGFADIYIRRAQLEQGAFPTSYIPTADAQVTRAADVASVNELSPWFNASEGTLVATYKPGAQVVAGTARRVAALSDGTLGNRIVLSFSDSQTVADAFVTVDGESQLNILNPVQTMSRIKAALAFKANYFGYSLNGQVTMQYQGSIPPTNILYIGVGEDGLVSAGVSPRILNGHIESLCFYPRAFFEAELQRITA